MAEAYILALIDIADEAAYRQSGYMARAEAAITAYGGRYLVRGGDPVSLEGEPPGSRIVILAFPNRERAAAFHASEQYAPAIALRQPISSARLILLSGYHPPA